jgi:hypothetical protein
LSGGLRGARRCGCRAAARLGRFTWSKWWGELQFAPNLAERGHSFGGDLGPTELQAIERWERFEMSQTGVGD